MRKLLLASVATLAGTIALSSGAQAQPAKAPAPGAVVVHLNGWFDFEAVALNNPNTGTTKYAPINTVGLFRLYPGFDATLKNGLQFGVASEIRDTLSAPNGAGVNGATATSAGGVNTASPNGTVSLYVRRAYGYVGTAEAGYVRFGQTDSAFSLMSYGDLEGFGDGQQFNSDLGTAALIYSGAPKNLFAVTGPLYTTSKVVYESPSFAGVNFAVGFEPNSNGLAEGTGNNQSGISSLAGGGPGNRRRNTIDAMVGYTGEMNGVGLKASAGYLDGSPLGNSTGAQPYKNLGIAQVGAQVAFSGAVLGVNYKNGAVNDGYGFLKAGQRHDSDILVSGTYTVGPVILGASYFFNQSAGAANGTTIARTETSDGAAVGANYNFSPNLGLFVQYLYGQVHQVGNTGDGVKGNGHTNAIGVGASLHW